MRLSKATMFVWLFSFIALQNIAIQNTALAHISIPEENKALTSQDCIACHKNETQAWKLSDHAMAMALPSNTSVLGDFNNVYARHFSQRGYFFTQNGQYKASIQDNSEGDGPLQNAETFVVKYTFGHYPLQQYLVETKPGTLHVLPFAWDTRSKQEGGQRWYHIYDEDIRAEDRLHWRQPLQNWNGMCADCHSDELVRNYDEENNTFNTHFSGINVGCVSCHGSSYEHIHQQSQLDQAQLDKAQLDQAQQDQAQKEKVQKEKAQQDYDIKEQGIWKLQEGDKTVSWSGPERDNAFMDTCFACHALRAPLTDGFAANTKFLDNFSPQLIVPPLYHADGQIQEEVYVYGSFLQSKMYQKGVNCLDCHDPHTMKLKIQGNGLCLQCHTAQEFDTPKHHRHPINTAGARCVNCHMPSETYMGVDDRRDHSFKIPRPDLSQDFNTPNACVACHTDQNNQWAADALQKWHGEPKPLSATRLDLLKLRHGQSISLQAHLMIAYDKEIDVITRASAIEMLNRSTDRLLPSQLRTFIGHTEGLIRLAAARVADLVPAQERASLLMPLLKDELGAVRTAAVQHLVALNIAETNIAAYTAAFKELMAANHNVAWRGEGRVNQGNIALQKGELVKAENAYKAAIDIDAYFPVGYMNLADFYRAKQREDLVAEILNQGMQKLPESADLAYSYGLHQVRQKDLPKAIRYFERSVKLAPSNPQLAYTYVLAIDGSGDTGKAIASLKALLPKYTNNAQLIELGLYLTQKAGARQDFEWFNKQRAR